MSDLDDIRDEAFVRGEKAAWRSMLGLVLQGSNIDVSGPARESWVLERLDAIATLRRLCNEYGDNDWPDTMNLSDIIEKYLIGSMVEKLDGK